MDKEQYLVVATSYTARTVDGWNGDYQENDEETQLLYGETIEEVLQKAGTLAEGTEFYSNVYNNCKVEFTPVFKIEAVAEVDGVSFYEARKAEAARKHAERIEQDRLIAERREANQKIRELAELERLRKKYSK